MLIPKTERVEVLSYIEEWKEREDPLMKELQVELGGSTVWLEIWGNNMLHDPSIRGIIINARDVTARKQAEAVLLRTRNKLALLHKIDTAILRADSSQEIAKVVIQLIEEHLVPADRLSIALFNLEKEEIFFLSVQSDESSAIKAGEVLPLSSFRNVDLLQKGEYYIVEDIEAKGVISDSDKALLNEGIRSYLIYPLLYRGELIGSLNLGSKDTDFFTETHIEVLSEAADQMALAIFDSRLNIEIKEQEEKFRGIFESISDLFYQTTMDGEILLVSPSCEQVTGYTVEEMEGKNVNEFLVDTEVRNKYINDVIGEGMAANFEFAIRHKSGKIVYLLDNSRLILDDNGEPIGTQGTLTDITELKDAQDQFIEEHQHALQYQSMLLSSQLNPHFIFNSLNSIQYYILDQSVEPALNYLADFSKLMRSVLQNSLRPHITLEEEIQFLTLYMDLERMRFANKFDYEFLVDDEIEEDLTMIPPMLLQPYLENTVVHGLAPKESDGHVLVEFKRDDKQVICSIKDNGIGRKKAEELKKLRTGGKSHRSVSMGINQTRLDLLNAVEDDAYTVQVTDLINVSGEPSGTEIMITFPIIVE